MAQNHVVKQGEHLTGIAEHYGFWNYKSVWDDGANAALAAKRIPHILHPDDIVTIPEKHIRQEIKPTTDTHPFVVKVSKLFLRVKVLDQDFNALKSSDYEAILTPEEKESPRQGSTDKDGIFKEQIKRPVEPVVDVRAQVTEVPKKGEPRTYKYEFKVGYLNPIHKLTGQQARLNNLGYFAGFDVKDTDQFWWAVEEFQEDQILMGKSKVKKTPKIVAETDDPNEPTGIVDDAPFLTKLKQVHGC